MSRVVEVSRQDLEARREEILRRVDVTLDELRARAEAGSLVGDEWEAWQAILDTEFLLGDVG